MKFIPDGISRKVAMAVLKSKKNSPHIFFAAGVVGVVGAGILACRSTLKLEETLDEIKHDLQQVNRIDVVMSPGVDTKEHVKDLGYVYLKSGVSLAKLYGPSIVVGGVAVACLTGSHVQMVKRNAAMSAAFAAVTTAFEDYRTRVQREIGEERELDIYRGVVNVEAEIDGKKKLVKVIDSTRRSPWARCFDEGNENYVKDPDYNFAYVRCQQQWLNDRLRSRGHVFLNEAYEALGFDEVPEGQLLGWLWQDGTEYIDLGIYEAGNENFVSGHERSVWLNFRPQGEIYKKI